MTAGFLMVNHSIGIHHQRKRKKADLQLLSGNKNSMKKCLLYIFWVLLCYYPAISFSQKPIVDNTFKESQINETDIKGLKQGYWRTIMPQIEQGRANHIYEGIYFNDKQVGVWKKKTYTGFTYEIEIFYDTSEFLAERILYYQNGSIKAKGHISSLPANDTVYVYDENKKDLSKPVYIKELLMRQGRWIYYYTNGKTASDGQYVADKKKGVWRYYNEKGELVNEEEN